MRKNVGPIDQTIRYVLAIVLVVIAVLGNAQFESRHFLWLLAPAVILGFTAAVSWCGLYRVFGINTCGIDEEE